MLPKYRALRKELSANAGLSSLWGDVKDTLSADIGVLEKATIDRRTRSPLKASGMDFEGGAASVYGWSKRGRMVNYIYAKATGRSEMSAEFYLAEIPAGGATLRITGINDDLGANGRIQIAMNDRVLYDGPADFRKDDFETKELSVPASVLKPDANALVIRMTEEKGTLGMPPWFMVAEAELIPKTN
jgi:hypothetical protein